MPIIVPALIATARGAAHRLAGRRLAPLGRAAARIARERRERASIARLAALDDARLYDLGVTREGLACALASRREPMRALRDCSRRERLARRLAPLRGARWGAEPARPFARERYLGW